MNGTVDSVVRFFGRVHDYWPLDMWPFSQLAAGFGGRQLAVIEYNVQFLKRHLAVFISQPTSKRQNLHKVPYYNKYGFLNMNIYHYNTSF